MFSKFRTTIDFDLRDVRTSALLLLFTGGAVLHSGCVHKPEVPQNPQSTNNNGGGNNGGGNNGGGDQPGDSTIFGEGNCDPDTVYFENDIRPILLSSCAKVGCHDPHSAQDGVMLTSYYTVMASGEVDPFRPDNSDLFEVLIEDDPDKQMPPPGEPQLTSDQIEMIRKWILQGALNNKCTDGCDTTNVTFKNQITTIIDKKCVNCHSGTSPQGNISLATYSQIKPLADNGRLWGAVNHESGYTAMPYNGGKLNSCELNLIRIWLKEGALNN